MKIGLDHPIIYLSLVWVFMIGCWIVWRFLKRPIHWMDAEDVDNAIGDIPKDPE